MPKGLKRYYGHGDLHFLTFSCYQRREFLATKRAKDLFVRELARVRREYGFKLAGYVVMPNHVHLLMSEPGKGSVSTVLQMLKQRVARKMRRGKPRAGQMALAFAPKYLETRAFWQARFYDFNVYSRGKLNEELNYMHANPVIRRLVKHPRDWAWSSWSNYMREAGPIEIDAM
ncbi:MAG TPA: transposase [Methylomirabilota bacterium]|nr:transposase [Methylomirabilota bacterium]